MKKQKTLWILILVLAAVIAGASILYQKLGSKMQMDKLAASEETETEEAEVPSGEETEQDNPAPDFSVEDGEGNEVKLSDFEGKPVVLNFWASWCGPCKMEMPDFEEAYQEYGEDVQFMMVNLTDGARETVEGAKAFIEESGYTFPVFYDTAYEAAIAYGVSSVPQTYFIDGQGRGVARGMGVLDKETLLKGIEMIR